MDAEKTIRFKTVSIKPVLRNDHLDHLRRDTAQKIFLEEIRKGIQNDYAAKFAVDAADELIKELGR